MIDRANQTPEQLVLPGSWMPGDTRPAVSLRLPSLVRDLTEKVAPNARPADARDRIAQWLTQRHAIGGFRPETVFARYAYELNRVRYDLVPNNVLRFVPNGTGRGLAGKPRRGGYDQHTVDPITVLREAQTAGGDPRRRFEAERDLALAYLSLWLVSDAELTGEQDHRRWDQDRKTAKDRNMFLDHLRRNDVITGETRLVRPVVLHNLQSPHRCLGIAVRGGSEFMVGDLTKGKRIKVDAVDMVRINLSGDQIPALFLPRRKGILQTIAKMLLSRLDTPLNVPDRRGVRFAYRTEEDLRAASTFISSKVCLGLIRKTHLENEDVPVNPYAAPNLLLVKDSAAFHDRTIEVQHLLARQHMDVQHSQGPEHYLLYHRRQYTAPDGLFPELFPREIYGVDWQSAQVQLMMDEHIRASFTLTA